MAFTALLDPFVFRLATLLMAPQTRQASSLWILRAALSDLLTPALDLQIHSIRASTGYQCKPATHVLYLLLRNCYYLFLVCLFVFEMGPPVTQAGLKHSL